MPKIHGKTGQVSDAATGRTTPAAREAAVATIDRQRAVAELAERARAAALAWLATGAHDATTARREFGVELPNRLLAPGMTATVAAVETAGVAAGHSLADVRAAIASMKASGSLLPGGTSAAPTLTRK
jgi:hypothetical protein